MKIKTIEIHNYRAFYLTTDPPIDVEGKNILIYGENGSGKSSLYHAIEHFFKAAHEPVQIRDQENLFYASPPYVKIEMDTGQIYTYQNDRTSPSEDFLKETHYHNPFFTYKRLLRTYLSETEEKKPDLFSLLVETIMPHHKNRLGEKTFREEWQQLKDALKLRKNSREYKQAVNSILPKFRNGLWAFLQDLTAKTNDWLSRYFRNNVILSFEPLALEIKENKSHKYIEGNELKLNIEYFGKSIPSPYHIFLNEARLSAFALCMYLASLKTGSEPPDYKILFLDDIFIGLDTSNRIPLLNILKNEFADYQIFLTTYDRHWFEIAKNHFDNNHWLSIEMYVGEKDGSDFEFPIIITPSDDYYAKAEKYANKKPDGNGQNIDYPAAANYLRKACERLLKDFLYGNYLLRSDGKTGEVNIRQDLGDLKDEFEKMMRDLGFDLAPFLNFTTVIRTTLNPFSHDNIGKPIYKTELQEAFDLIKNLKQLKKIVLIPINEVISNEKSKPDGTIRKTFLKVKSDMLLFKQGAIWKIPKCTLKPLHYIENSLQTSLKTIPECHLSKAYDMICHDIYEIKNASQTTDIYAEFKSEITGQTLRDMADTL